MSMTDDVSLNGCAVPTLYFLRHGQTHWNAQRRIQGQLDTELSALGVEQAQRQRTLLKPVLKTKPALFVSPLKRTRHTADIAFSGAEYQTDKRLVEAHVGDWQGQYWETLMQENAFDFDPDLPVLEMYLSAPNAEDLGAFRRRIRDFVLDLDQPSVVVSHALVAQVLRGMICGLSWSDTVRLPYEQACVYVLENAQESVLR